MTMPPLLSSMQPGVPAKPKSYYNTDVIAKMLEDLRSRKQQAPGYRDYMQPAPFEELAPKKLDTKFTENDLYEQIQQQILTNNRTATDIVRVKAQNKANYQAYQSAKNAQKYYQPPKGGYTYNGPGVTPTGPGTKPHYPLNAGVGSNLGHYKWRGFNLTLNKNAAGAFVGFLSALYKRGYRPSSIGSYANRNIAGTNSKSLHAYGLAIDIDPGRNPVTWNGHNITALPPGVGALAAKYGLTWGGNWNGSKRDTMHFSVPYGGRK